MEQSQSYTRKENNGATRKSSGAIVSTDKFYFSLLSILIYGRG